MNDDIVVLTPEETNEMLRTSCQCAYYKYRFDENGEYWHDCTKGSECKSPINCALKALSQYEKAPLPPEEAGYLYSIFKDGDRLNTNLDNLMLATAEDLLNMLHTDEITLEQLKAQLDENELRLLNRVAGYYLAKAGVI